MFIIHWFPKYGYTITESSREEGSPPAGKMPHCKKCNKTTEMCVEDVLEDGTIIHMELHSVWKEIRWVGAALHHQGRGEVWSRCGNSVECQGDRREHPVRGSVASPRWIPQSAVCLHHLRCLHFRRSGAGPWDFQVGSHTDPHEPWDCQSCARWQTSEAAFSYLYNI